nr:MAG TPA: hypothetical protein [Caudoviricetes sp.]
MPCIVSLRSSVLLWRRISNSSTGCGSWMCWWGGIRLR